MSKTTVTSTNQMTPDEIDGFLASKRVGSLGTTCRDGAVHITPIWQLWRGGKIYLILGTSRLHLKNMYRDPRATICIDADPRLTEGFDAGAQGVVMRCSVELTTDPEIREFVYREIADLYEVADDPKYIAARDSEERVIAILTPKRTTAWDFNKG